MKDLILQTVISSIAAVLVGGLIGSERAHHGRAAGMRTHVLVCLGACMTSLTSVYVSQILGINGDVFRISAQVISGVGFLGAGMIILKNNNTITGLTTAAGVWTTATIGVALGYGFYLGAAVVTVLFIITMLVFAQFEKSRKNAEVIYVELDDMYMVNEVADKIKELAAQPFTFSVVPPKSNKSGNIGLLLTFERYSNIDISEIDNLQNVAFAIIDHE